MKTQEVFASLNLAFGLVLAIKLLKLDLHKLYKLFSAYLILDLLETATYLTLRIWAVGDIDYRWIWSIVQFCKCSLYVWMAIALLSKVMESVPGVLHLSRKIFAISLVGGVCCGLASLLVRLRDLTAIPALDIVLAIKSAILVVVLLLLLLVLGFIFWFPVELPRNLVLFSSGYLIFFSAQFTVFFFARSSEELWLDALSTINIAVSTCCLIFWLATLTVAGEERKSRVGHQWNAEEQSRLVGQLAAINNSLVKTAKGFSSENS